METYNKLKSAIQTGDIATFEAIMEKVKTISEKAYDNNYGEMLDYMTNGFCYAQIGLTAEDSKIINWHEFEDLFLGTDIMMICSQIDEN